MVHARSVLLGLVATALVLFTSASAFAQEPSAPAPSSSSGSGSGALHDGATSLSLGIPGGGNPYAAGTMGLFFGFGSDMNVGFNIGIGLDTETQPDDDFNFLFAPVIKYYLMPGSEVSPFWLGQLNFGFTSRGDDAIDISIAGGFGAEWFITDVFSLAGYTGIGIDLLRPNDVGPFRLGTFTSGFTGQIYF